MKPDSPAEKEEFSIRRVRKPVGSARKSQSARDQHYPTPDAVLRGRHVGSPSAPRHELPRTSHRRRRSTARRDGGELPRHRGGLTEGPSLPFACHPGRCTRDGSDSGARIGENRTVGSALRLRATPDRWNCPAMMRRSRRRDCATCLRPCHRGRAPRLAPTQGRLRRMAITRFPASVRGPMTAVGIARLQTINCTFSRFA